MQCHFTSGFKRNSSPNANFPSEMHLAYSQTTFNNNIPLEWRVITVHHVINAVTKNYHYSEQRYYYYQEQ